MFINKFKKPKGPELDEKTASQMLGNIFDACEVEPNSVPLTVLTSYSNYRRERFLLQRILLVIILLFFCLTPLLFIPPDIQLSLREDSSANQPAYELRVDTIIPVSRITATIEGRNVSVYETAERTYSIEPTVNGTMTVTVTLKNKQYASMDCEVVGVDTEPPVVVSDKMSDGQIYIYLSDAGSGIDYENITAVDIDGKDVTFDSYDEEKNYVIFDYPKTSLNVYIPDNAGNKLHLILTVK